MFSGATFKSQLLLLVTVFVKSIQTSYLVPPSDSWFTPSQSMNSTLSEQCLKDTMIQLTAIRDRQLWAIEMYESSGMLTDKLVESDSGNVYHDMGLFDECLAAVDPIRDKDIISSFEAKYCTIFFHQQQGEMTSNEGEPVDNMSNFVIPSVAFCIPSTCSARELRSAMASRVRHLSLVSITSEDYCYTRDKIRSQNKFGTGAIATSCVIGLILVLVIVATIYDIFWNSSSTVSNKNESNNRPISKQTIADFLHCFSAKRNAQALLSTKVNADTKNLSCLNGIRVICTILIIMGHGTSKYLSNTKNTRSVYMDASRMDLQVFVNGMIFVEPFFLMSGFLVSIMLMRHLDQSKGSFNVLHFYFHRYIRLTPFYAVAIAFVANALPLMSYAPDWHYIRQLSETVSQLWWTQLLYINNYVLTPAFGWNSPKQGMIESWYLSVDMQMFWLSPLFVYPLWRWKKAGLVWVIICLFAFLAASAVPYFWFSDLLPSGFVFRLSAGGMEKMSIYWHNYYLQTYCRIPPYIIGILLGGLLHKTNNQGTTVHLNKFVVAVGWLISISFGLFAIFGLFFAIEEDSFFVGPPQFSSFFRIGYGVFHGTAFALSVAWVIFACANQYGGFVNTLLTLKVFMPLSRLGYAAYLINVNLIRSYYANQRSPSYYTKSEILMLLPGIVGVVILLSFLASLTVELPFLNLSKLFFPIKRPATATANGHHHHHNNKDKKQ